MITTVAGNGSKVYFGDGGPATNAGLVEPNGVALHSGWKDLAHRRRRRPPDPPRGPRHGLITTFAGTGRPRHDGDGGPAASGVHLGCACRRRRDRTDRSTSSNARGTGFGSSSPKTGIITTLAGTGTKGYTGDGGPALSATFNGPKELAVDSKGNIWIVDTENHVIRRHRRGDPKRSRPSPETATPGGDGDGGPATQARLDRPHGVAVGPTARAGSATPIIIVCGWSGPGRLIRDNQIA